MERQHKHNKPMTRIQGLCLLLLLVLSIGCLVAATGTTFARYRSESKEDLLFQVREPNQVLLGTVQMAQADSEKETFASSERLEWTVQDGIASLTFSAANGSDSENFSPGDQAVRLRMLGSLTLAEKGTMPELVVTYVYKKTMVDGTEKEETKTVTGEVSYIVEGSSLYNTYGPGCLYTFYETTAEGKREVTWELPGGKLSYITLTIQSTGDISGITGVLQPLILADTIGN